MIFVAFTAITVAILEAMASARKAIYSLLAKDPRDHRLEATYNCKK